jgi:hypothetical protein
MAEEKWRKICELKENNYVFWAFQVKNLLISKDLWNAVYEEPLMNPGPRPEAAEGDDDIGIEVWEEQNRLWKQWKRESLKAMSEIAKYIDRSNANLLYNVEDGREAWTILKNYHNSTSLANKMRSDMRLMELKLTKDKTMMQHLSELQEVFNEQAEFGQPLDEVTKVTHMFRTVGRDYSALATAVLNWSRDRITVYAAKEQLIDEWRKKQQFQLEEEKEQQAMKAEQERAMAVQRAEAMAVERDRARQMMRKRFKTEQTCFKCGKKGHYQRECPEMRNTGDLRWKLNMKALNKNSGFGEEYASCLFIEPVSMDDWIIDSGATKHMTSDKRVFKVLMKHDGGVTVANGEKLPIVGIGTVRMKIGVDYLELKDVLLVPGLDANLISVNQLIENNIIVKFSTNGVYIGNGSKEKRIGGLNKGHFRLSSSEACLKAEDKEVELCVHEWHKRLGHRNLADIMRMRSQGLKIRECSCSDDCEPCLKGKMARRKLPKKARETENVMDLVVSDVCGPMQVESAGRKRYFVTFIDAHSGYCEVKFIRTKDEAADEAIKYVERMKTQLGKKPKVFRSDRGKEYVNEKLRSYLEAEGIKIQYDGIFTRRKWNRRKNESDVDGAIKNDAGGVKVANESLG